MKLLEVEHLKISFTENGGVTEAVRDLSFSMEVGEILGVVGESGSGKSQTALAVMNLLKEDAHMEGGRIRLMNQELTVLDERSKSKIRGDRMAMIFQEPMSSLNPVQKIGPQVEEVLKLHTALSPQGRHHKVIQAFEQVELHEPELLYHKYPHELSGGMRQRVMIAMAMICSPNLLIADEPTTALDIMVQAQILELLKSLNKEQKIGILFISHDLNVIRQVCDRVLVMYQGQIVEQGDVTRVLNHPEHEYTKRLVASVPQLNENNISARPMLSFENLNAAYKDSRIFKKPAQEVLHNINLTIFEGEIFGIVGESGSGKSTLARTIVGLNRQYSGTMSMDPLLKPQMVFQDPFGSLNPARKLGWLLAEPLRLRGIKDKREQQARIDAILTDIGLEPSYADRYAAELSGGQRQRISIAIALLMNSKLLVADEPVSALDVTVQSQILKLLLKVYREKGLTMIFISHDLNLVRHFCHRVAVMRQGEIVEQGEPDKIWAHPKHPYTKQLIAAASGMHGEKGKDNINEKY